MFEQYYEETFANLGLYDICLLLIISVQCHLAQEVDIGILLKIFFSKIDIIVSICLYCLINLSRYYCKVICCPINSSSSAMTSLCSASTRLADEDTNSHGDRLKKLSQVLVCSIDHRIVLL